MLGGMYFTLDFPTSMAVIWLGTALGVCVSGAFPRSFATPPSFLLLTPTTI